MFMQNADKKIIKKEICSNFVKVSYLTIRRTSPDELMCFSLMAMFLYPMDCSFFTCSSFRDTLHTQNVQNTFLTHPADTYLRAKIAL